MYTNLRTLVCTDWLDDVLNRFTSVLANYYTRSKPPEQSDIPICEMVSESLLVASWWMFTAVTRCQQLVYDDNCAVLCISSNTAWVQVRSVLGANDKPGGCIKPERNKLAGIIGLIEHKHDEPHFMYLFFAHTQSSFETVVVEPL